MPIDLTRVQDVYKDAGDSIIFVTMNLNRQDQASDLAAVQDLAEHLPAFINSMNIRYPDAGLAVAFGFSRSAWDYLFPTAKRPAELEEFQAIHGQAHCRRDSSRPVFPPAGAQLRRAVRTAVGDHDTHRSQRHHPG